MFTESKVSEIFYLADEFCKFFDAEQEKSMLSAPQEWKKHHRKQTFDSTVRSGNR